MCPHSTLNGEKEKNHEMDIEHRTSNRERKEK